jgi:hypothetical protein
MFNELHEHKVKPLTEKQRRETRREKRGGSTGGKGTVKTGAHIALRGQTREQTTKPDRKKPTLRTP